MKTKIIALLLLLPSVVFGQIGKTKKPKIKWGEIAKGNRYFVFDKTIHAGDNGYYFIKEGNPRGDNRYYWLSIEHYDEDMNFVNSIKHALTKKSRPIFFNNTAFLNGELILFSTFGDKKNKQNVLYSQVIDLDDLSLSEREIVASYPRKGGYNSIDYKISFSKDKTKVMVYNTLSLKMKRKVYIKVLDSKLSKLWETKADLPFLVSLSSIVEMIVGNNGNVYSLFKIYNNKKKEIIKKQINYNFSFVSFSKEGSTLKYNITLKNKKILNAKIAVNKENVYFTGYYSFAEKVGIEGVFMNKYIVNSVDAIHISYNKFSKKFLTQYHSVKEKKKAQKKGKYKITEYTPKDIIFHSNGMVSMVAEQQYEKAITQQGYGYIEYHCDNIMVLEFNKEGEIKSNIIIPKSQYGTINYFLSYSLQRIDDKLHIIFHDDIKNMKPNPKGKIEEIEGHTIQYKGILLVDVIIANSKATKNILIRYNPSILPIFIRSISSVNNLELILFSQKIKKNRIGKITFK